MAASDPITIIGQQISFLLKNCPALTTMKAVYDDSTGAAENFVRFRTNLQPGDMPYIAFYQGDYDLTPQIKDANSGPNDFATQAYCVAMVTDQTQAPVLNQVKAAVNAALKLANSCGTNLGLDGLVYNYTIRNARDSLLPDKNWTRQTLHYWSVMSINVTYYISYSNLNLIYQGEYTYKSDPPG